MAEWLSGMRHNHSMVDSPAAMSGTRTYPSLVDDLPALLGGTRSNPALVIESPVPLEGNRDHLIFNNDENR